jgi:hypothetical protein
MNNLIGGFMQKLVKMALPVLGAVTLLVIGTSSALNAATFTSVPEIDPTTGTAAAALLAGAVLASRGWRKK